MGIKATLFIPPNGREQEIIITEINEADELWFVENNAKLSGEELMNGQQVIYADVGLKDEEGEPLEGIEISQGRSCRETIAALRVQCEKLLKEHE